MKGTDVETDEGRREGFNWSCAYRSRSNAKVRAAAKRAGQILSMYVGLALERAVSSSKPRRASETK
jgi:hypothetical protein